MRRVYIKINDVFKNGLFILIIMRIKTLKNEPDAPGYD